MIQILSIIAPLFLIILGAALIQRSRNLGEEWNKVLNEYALKIGLPVLIFSALSKASFSFKEEALLILVNSVFLLANFIFAIALGKFFGFKKQLFLTLFICFTFGNVAYMGIPLLTEVFGNAALPTASLIVAIYLFWIFTIGTAYLDYASKKKNRTVLTNILKNFIKNPLLISVVLGILVGSFKVELPIILSKTLDMLSASVTPTVLIVMGLFIGKSKLGKISEWVPILIFSLFTLLVFPALFYFGVQAFGAPPAQFKISIIQAAMPLAITPFALADKYDLNKIFIARSIVLTTILSIFTLPFWVSLLA